MKRARSIEWLLLALLCAILCPVAHADSVYLPLVGRYFFDRPMTWATVTYVWDGDTFDIDTDGDGLTDDRVRPIGIDTPEVSFGVECYGPEAKTRAKELLDGQRVALERDVSDRDDWDRLLRYVYLPHGQWINGTLVREGFARVTIYPPDDRYSVALYALEDLAIAEGAGGWAACGW